MNKDQGISAITVMTVHSSSTLYSMLYNALPICCIYHMCTKSPVEGISFVMF